MFPRGIEITAHAHDQQLEQARTLMQRDEVAIFEAAVSHGNLFARVDILRKRGSRAELIEVEAKSFDSTTPFVATASTRV